MKTPLIMSSIRAPLLNSVPGRTAITESQRSTPQGFLFYEPRNIGTSKINSSVKVRVFTYSDPCHFSPVIPGVFPAAFINNLSGLRFFNLSASLLEHVLTQCSFETLVAGTLLNIL